MKSIDKISRYDITEYTLTFIGKTEILQMRKALSEVIDNRLVESLGDDMVINLYETVEKIVEDEIRKTILTEYDQKPLEKGSQVKMTCDVCELKKGDIVTIDEVGRFDEDTFGYGWYYYMVGKYRLYMCECSEI